MCVVNGKSLSLSTSKRKHHKYFSLLRGKFSTNRRRFLQLLMAQLISILSYNFVQLQFFCAVSLIRPRFSFLEFITKYPALKMKNAYKSYIFLTISHPLLMVMVQRIKYQIAAPFKWIFFLCFHYLSARYLKYRYCKEKSIHLFHFWESRME